MWGIPLILALRERGEVNKIKKEGERCMIEKFQTLMKALEKKALEDGKTSMFVG